MITELKIEGFKSFGTPAQCLSLGPLNFVVGANASGKTNLISALHFLQNAVLQNAEFAVNELGGITEVRNKILRGRKVPKPLKLDFRMDFTNFDEVRVKVHKDRELRFLNFTYSVNLDLRSDSGLPEVDSENLTAAIKDEQEQTLNYRLQRNKREVEIIDPTEGKGQSYKIKVPEQETTRLALGVGFFSIPCVVLREIIANWRFYNISPHLARVPSKETPDADLGPSGENLAVILHKLEQQNGKGAIDSITAGLKSTVSGFRGIKTMQLPIEGQWAFQVLEEKIRGTINPNSVSDGTIRLLALMVIANWTAKHSPLIAIEEPENGVHPHLTEHLVGILRAAAENRQFIVTTHNPTFLDYLEPNEVILCDKVDGFTKLRRASDIPEIKNFKKHFRLGELWVQGTLGGIP
jgi:predicted ATPase